ncbi:MAG: hypothetical protein EHM16_08750 [Betaproteobacteria bacterium]|nr:MAG: hypothetical protein EHM16_08750 [Betaproteobacteria bacterium]
MSLFRITALSLLLAVAGCCTFCGTDVFVRPAQYEPNLVYVTLGWEIVEAPGGVRSDATRQRVMKELEKSKVCSKGYVFKQFVGNTSAHYTFQANCE